MTNHKYRKDSRRKTSHPSSQSGQHKGRVQSDSLKRDEVASKVSALNTIIGDIESSQSFSGFDHRFGDKFSRFEYEFKHARWTIALSRAHLKWASNEVAECRNHDRHRRTK